MSKLRINYSEIINRLKKEEFSEEEINKIASIFNSFPFIVDINSGLVEAGEHFKIKIYNGKMEEPKKEDLIYNGWFDLEVEGLNSNRVLSVELPKLDIRNINQLELKVELCTTDLCDKVELLSTDLDNKKEGEN